MMLDLLLFLEKGKACRTCKSFMQHYFLSVLWFSVACLDLVAGLHTLTGPSEVKQCAGRSVHIVCHYHSFYRDNVKYWCKGYYFNYCTILIRTSQSQNIYGPLQITDNKSNGFFTIHMKNVKAEDSGWYWCAIERVSRHRSVSMQLFISAEAQHCSIPLEPTHNIRETTIRPPTSALTTFRTTTITSTYLTTLKTTDLTEMKHETLPEEIYVTEHFAQKIWNVARWILFISMCLYLTCFIACFEIWFRRR
ncbi:hypothetical protein KOW79_005456 [Hemibagrus wyckioides]|uniref:Ig-like domain-containing protein n=1 Tax=Hemibagrus wyckioides TaxID=337641 RepID=A0A9D3P2U9_9TELE|nr:CMRF35-like molecule 7 [Hemibagrus wyckioides]KAG7331487.1 hypothetical protein KOW79_005456 [Hemibagrus wyckioides]